MAEQFRLAHAVVAIAIAGSLGAMSDDGLCPRVAEDGIAEVIRLPLGVIAPVGGAGGAGTAVDGNLHALVKQGGDEGVLAANGKAFGNGLRRIDFRGKFRVLVTGSLKNI